MQLNSVTYTMIEPHLWTLETSWRHAHFEETFQIDQTRGWVLTAPDHVLRSMSPRRRALESDSDEITETSDSEDWPPLSRLRHA
eukprot:6033961-Pyramimonas_sp.AAC.1